MVDQANRGRFPSGVSGGTLKTQMRGSGGEAGSSPALKDLYQEMILDHNKKPRNFFKMEGANRQAEGYNPLCGDQMRVYLKMDGDKIQDISFEGSGCAISKSSGSMMTMTLKGKTLTEAEDIFQKFHHMLTGDVGAELPAELGKLAVFSGVCEFPSRVKCATLAWHTMKSALEGKDEVISTEVEDAKVCH